VHLDRDLPGGEQASLGLSEEALMVGVRASPGHEGQEGGVLPRAAGVAGAGGSSDFKTPQLPVSAWDLPRCPRALPETRGGCPSLGIARGRGRWPPAESRRSRWTRRQKSRSWGLSPAEEV